MNGSSDEAIKVDVGSIIISCAVVVGGTLLGLLIKVKVESPKVGNVIRVIAFVGLVGGIGTLVLSFYINMASDTPIYSSALNIVACCFFQVICSLSIGLFASKIVFKLPNPSCMALGTETSTQNILISLAILSISLSKADADAAMIIPLLYGSANSSTNTIFGLIAWKVLGWSNVSKDTTAVNMIKGYMDLLKKKRDGGGEGMGSEVQPMGVADGGEGGL